MKPFFVFSGQGAQAVGMGRDLYDHSPAARAVFEVADVVLGYKLSEVCFDGPAEKLTDTRFCQVAIYTVSCAALEAFKERYPRIAPVGCAGLSLGEYSALCAAGAVSFVEGLQLLNKRAELMAAACESSNGAMASVIGGDAEIIKQVCAECGIDVANYNSPAQIVISGDKDKVAQAVELLKPQARKVVPLQVSGAFHSRLMAGAGALFARTLDESKITMPVIPVYHNYTGAMARDLNDVKNQLARQIAGSVKWESCVRALINAGGDTMIEFGPGTVLTGLLKRTVAEVPGYNVNSVASLDALQF